MSRAARFALLASSACVLGGRAPPWLPSWRPSAEFALRDAESADADWEFVSDKNGVRVWKRLPTPAGGGDGDAEDRVRRPFAVKAVVVMPVPARRVADTLLTRDYDLIRRRVLTRARRESKKIQERERRTESETRQSERALLFSI